MHCHCIIIKIQVAYRNCVPTCLQADKLKSYPLSLQRAVQNGEMLYANRRGIVPLLAESDKPSITPSELVQMRRLGLSFKQIGKKLGVDPHKDEVVQVYQAIQEATGLDIEKDVNGPSKVSPSNPLWYTFRSEQNVIAENVIPHKEDVLSLRPQQRIKERLGEHAGFMLGIYQQVQAITHEEILSSLKQAPPKSQVGRMTKWIPHLQLSICQSVFSVEEAVGQEAYELTEYWQDTAGRCRCSSVKVIRFGWKESPIPYPSFFWGCARYTPIDSHSHDKGIPIKKSCWSILEPDSDSRGYSQNISDTELERLSNKFTLIDEFWSDDVDNRDRNELEQLVKNASDVYGGPKDDLPLSDISEVRKTIESLRERLKFLKDERVTAVLHEE